MFGTAVSSRNGRAIATFLNFYVSHHSATKLFRNGEKLYLFYKQFITVSNNESIFKIG